ncbi:hypothetical protein [Rhodococcus sp. HNM0569]|uniref:hypothetical protein n=1 Tax=Rhodococcus sp. HNM0569 TaxID=2716340 RepID=UPI00146F707A|nr:hypothetical protein [Rhodococcus sp. HNM0569]NLU83010.1 hypothetical protein [Rhodococcus sp. HNM0569]
MSATTDHAHDHDQHDRQYPRDRERQVADQDTGRTPEPAAETTPEAVQAAKTAHRNRTGRTTTADSGRRVQGVEWVRPTDLLARQSATVAGRGIDFEVELARRTRNLTSHVAQASSRGVGRVGKTIGERTRRLPDVSEFGRGSRHQSWVSRSGIGLG